MKNPDNVNKLLSRRKFLGTTTAAAAAVSLTPLNLGFGSAEINSTFGGVQIGAITYSWRSMPTSAQDIINYCTEAGIGTLELMGDVAENYAGIPQGPDRPPRGAELSDEEREEYEQAREEAAEIQREWRLSVSMDKYEELRTLFDEAGIDIHIVKFAPANWSDEEIDYAFNAARILGATGITNEIGEEACQRLGPFAEKHDMYAIYHNHTQPGDPDFSFDTFLEYSPNNMLNFDAGHYFGATGEHPNGIIERLHDRIVSIHTKDKTGKFADPPNTNMPWGEGGTPIADMLQLVQENNWPIVFDIELEYPVPEGSTAQEEIIKCVEYCRNILV